MPTALIIDGDRSRCEALSQRLGLLDITARPAYNPHAALLTLADAEPDLIFLSSATSGEEGEGLEFLEFLQAESALAGIPVVMLVEDPGRADDPDYKQVGAIAAISSGANLEALEIVLRKAGIF